MSKACASCVRTRKHRFQAVKEKREIADAEWEIRCPCFGGGEEKLSPSVPEPLPHAAGIPLNEIHRPIAV
jgi:hypothetical protein